MDVFHVVIDTSILRRAHFRHPDFERLLHRSRLGALRLYIPYIALEEQRTSYLDAFESGATNLREKFNKLQRSDHAILFEGLPQFNLTLPTKEEVDRNSRAVLERFLDKNKIEVIPFSIDHATEAWKIYFDAAPPFNPDQDRIDRRKDIPDSWILVAGKAIRAKQGRHCALVGDKKLKQAFEGEEFETFDDIETLDLEVERSTAVIHHGQLAQVDAGDQLQDLRGAAFKDIDVIVLGFIEALGGPTKRELSAALEKAGIDLAIAAHESKTLVLSGVLMDTGEHFLPTNRTLAQQAATSQIVIPLLARIL
ncbi:PIN domain-containing protein [Lysobacter gummosus]|uniref:PIN domain-containing protein n=1 Tax=Lysobacter gummosus TaxID=262324 RepID=UPI003634F43C